MRVYVASSWRNDRQPIVVESLRKIGHEVYDFRYPHLGPGRGGKGFQWGEIDPDWQDWTPEQFRACLHEPVAQDGLESDLLGIKWADVCVLVMPCGRSAHLELGYAIGLGKKAYILLDSGEPELMYGMVHGTGGDLCVSLEELVDCLGVQP